MTRFSKVFQLLTVVLVVAVLNVYVMGAPKASTDPKKADAPATTATTTDLASAENVANAKVTPVAVASEKLKLAPGSKVDFNRIFSRSEIASRATANQNFLNGKAAPRDLFKAPPRAGMVPEDDKDSGGGGSRGTWIALGVIAAVATIAVIGLRKDRSDQTGSSAPH